MNWPFRKGRAEIDAETAKQAQHKRLEALLQIGNEEEFVEMVKEAEPGVKPEKLVALIEHFREIRRQRAKRGS